MIAAAAGTAGVVCEARCSSRLGVCSRRGSEACMPGCAPATASFRKATVQQALYAAHKAEDGAQRCHSSSSCCHCWCGDESEPTTSYENTMGSAVRSSQRSHEVDFAFQSTAHDLSPACCRAAKALRHLAPGPTAERTHKRKHQLEAQVVKAVAGCLADICLPLLTYVQHVLLVVLQQQGVPQLRVSTQPGRAGGAAAACQARGVQALQDGMCTGSWGGDSSMVFVGEPVGV